MIAVVISSLADCLQWFLYLVLWLSLLIYDYSVCFVLSITGWPSLLRIKTSSCLILFNTPIYSNNTFIIALYISKVLQIHNLLIKTAIKMYLSILCNIGFGEDGLFSRSHLGCDASPLQDTHSQWHTNANSETPPNIIMPLFIWAEPQSKY